MIEREKGTMMNRLTLFIPKDTDWMRSTFIAVGLASLLYELLPVGSGMEVRIRDLGSAYQVTSGMELEAYRTRVQERGYLPPLLPALVKKYTPAEQRAIDQSDDPEAERQRIRQQYVPQGFLGTIVDYVAEKSKPSRHILSKKDEVQEGAPSVRPPDYPLWEHVLSNFGSGKGIDGYRKVLRLWHIHQGENALKLFDLIIDFYGGQLEEPEEALKIWKKYVRPQREEANGNVTALSIIAPTASKGVFSPSAASYQGGKQLKTFWLESYLNWAGYMEVGMPFRSGSDALMYYPLPQDITFSNLRHLINEYRASPLTAALYHYAFSYPRAKLDILSQNVFYQSMVEHLLSNPPESRHINLISGLVGYYYKNLTSHTPFDEVTFRLPPWLPDDADDEVLEHAQTLLKEHHNIISALRGEFAEDLSILAAYRRFITHGEPEAWIDFCIQYNQYRFSKLLEQSWLPLLSLELLEETLMNQEIRDYRPILQNPGFRNIAKAIRSCTVDLRYWKDVKNQNTQFKVRHGLGADLLRVAHDAERFVETLSDFVHDYTRESANVQAQFGETRPFITVDDLEDVIGLVSEYGSRVVASLLVAAGYASDYQRKEQSA